MTYNRAVCWRCGDFTDLQEMRESRQYGLMCKPCQQIETTLYMKEFYAKKRAEGWKPKRLKIAGRKASITRIARLIYRDPVKYQKAFSNMLIKDPKKAGAIKRRAKKIMIARHNWFDADLGKTIF